MVNPFERVKSAVIDPQLPGPLDNLTPLQKQVLLTLLPPVGVAVRGGQALGASANAAKTIAGYAALPAVAVQADLGDPADPLTQYARGMVGTREGGDRTAKTLEYLRHPGRQIGALRESPNAAASWLAGGLEMAADPLNYLGPVAKGLQSTRAARVGQVLAEIDRAQALPVELLAGLVKQGAGKVMAQQLARRVGTAGDDAARVTGKAGGLPQQLLPKVGGVRQYGPIPPPPSGVPAQLPLGPVPPPPATLPARGLPGKVSKLDERVAALVGTRLPRETIPALGPLPLPQSREAKLAQRVGALFPKAADDLAAGAGDVAQVLPAPTPAAAALPTRQAPDLGALIRARYGLPTGAVTRAEERAAGELLPLLDTPGALPAVDFPALGGLGELASDEVDTLVRLAYPGDEAVGNAIAKYPDPQALAARAIERIRGSNQLLGQLSRADDALARKLAFWEPGDVAAVAPPAARSAAALAGAAADTPAVAPGGTAREAFDRLIASRDDGKMGAYLPGADFFAKRLGIPVTEARGYIDDLVRAGVVGDADGALAFRPPGGAAITKAAAGVSETAPLPVAPDEPLTLYHGSPRRFAPGDITPGRPGMYGSAISLTTDRNRALGYARALGTEGVVHGYTPNITNPIEINDLPARFKGVGGKRFDELFAQLRDPAGNPYDAVVDEAAGNVFVYDRGKLTPVVAAGAPVSNVDIPTPNTPVGALPGVDLRPQFGGAQLTSLADEPVKQAAAPFKLEMQYGGMTPEAVQRVKQVDAGQGMLAGLPETPPAPKGKYPYERRLPGVNATFRSMLPPNAKVPSYNRGDEASVIYAAQRYMADRPLYVVPTHYGFALDTSPPFGREIVAVMPDGAVVRTPYEPGVVGDPSKLVVNEVAEAADDTGTEALRAEFRQGLARALERGNADEANALMDIAGEYGYPPGEASALFDELTGSGSLVDQQRELIEASPYFAVFKHFNPDGSLKRRNPITGKVLRGAGGKFGKGVGQYEEVWNIPESGYDDVAAAAMAEVGGYNPAYGASVDDFWPRAQQAFLQYRNLKRGKAIAPAAFAGDIAAGGGGGGGMGIVPRLGGRLATSAAGSALGMGTGATVGGFLPADTEEARRENIRRGAIVGGGIGAGLGFSAGGKGVDPNILGFAAKAGKGGKGQGVGDVVGAIHPQVQKLLDANFGGRPLSQLSRDEFRALEQLADQTYDGGEFARMFRAVDDEFGDIQQTMRDYAQDLAYENPGLVAKLRRLRPDDTVTIFRAAGADDPNAIRPGDWVTLERRYALEHGASGFDEAGSKIVGAKVPARDVAWAGTSVDEWLYRPKELAGRDLYDVITGGAGGQSPVPSALGVIPYPGGLSGAVSRAVIPASAGGLLGGVAGAGAGAAADDEDRFGGALKGAALGAGLGFTAGAAGSMAGLDAPLRQVAADVAENVAAIGVLTKEAAGAGVKAQREALAATGSGRFLPSPRDLYGYWKRTTVEHPKNLLQDETWVRLVVRALQGKDASDLLAPLRRESAGRLGKAGREALPQSELDELAAIGLDTYTPDYGQALAASEAQAGRALNAAQRTTANVALSVVNPASVVTTPLGLAASAARGVGDAGWSGFFQALNGVLQQTGRIAIARTERNAMLQQADTLLRAQYGIADSALPAGGMFSPAQVERVAGKRAADHWAAFRDEAVKAGEQRAKTLLGDYSDKGKRGWERALGGAVPFVSWAVRAYPVVLRMALAHPLVALGVYHYLRATVPPAGKDGRPEYTAGMIPIDDKTPFLGLIARYLLGGAEGTAYLDPIGSFSPVGGELFAADDGRDKNWYQQLSGGLGRVGLPQFGPVPQAIAYATGLDYKAPSFGSRNRGIEEALALVPGNPELPNVGAEALRAARGFLSPRAEGRIPGAEGDKTPEAYDPVTRRYGELVMQRTGKPLNDPANRAYLVAIADPANPLLQQARREALLGGAAKNVASLTSPVYAAAQTDENRGYRAAAAGLPFSYDEVQGAGAYPRLKGAMEQANAGYRAGTPAADTYRIGGREDAAWELLRAWEKDNAGLALVVPSAYARLRRQKLEELGLREPAGAR